MLESEQNESLENKCTHPIDQVVIWGEMQMLATCKICGEDFYADEVLDEFGFDIREEQNGS